MVDPGLERELRTALGNFEIQPDIQHNLVELEKTWAAQVEKLKARAPYLKIEDGGETIVLGSLSPGCRACKTGAWDCLFLTMDCNLSCSFCCSPGGGSAHPPFSALGVTENDALANLQIVRPEGISFSGGEVFREYARLRSLVEQVRNQFPRVYLWVYSNGVLADAEKLTELAELGLDEIRFNLAATGYTNPTVLKHVAQASQMIENVTVEIPAIPSQRGQLIGALHLWQEAGVKFLNLHELMYEPGSLSETMPGPRLAVHTPDGHQTEIHPKSREVTFAVMEEVYRSGLAISVNDCSMQNKLRQVRGRRELVGRYFSQAPGSFETLDQDGLLVSICGLDRRGGFFFLRSADLAEARRQYPEFNFVRLWRVPPLSIYSPKVWLKFAEIGD
jgi:pyruvate formate-lyase activating enzyme-like uncharacterized protein